jgi:hypothetical protein
MTKDVTKIRICIHRRRVEKLLKSVYKCGSPLSIDWCWTEDHASLTFDGAVTAGTASGLTRIIVMGYLASG